MDDYRVVSSVREHARERGSSAAITAGGPTVTYAELSARASRFAQALRAAGVQPGGRVCYVGKPIPEYADVLCGAPRVGAVCTPVNWRLTPAEIAAIITDAKALVTVVDAEFAELAAELPGTVIVTGEPYEGWLAGHPAEDPGYTGDPDDVVVQLYTSGTTGVPKGVQLTNVNLGGGYEAPKEPWTIDEDSSVMVAAPVFHIGGTGLLVIAFRAGARVVLLRDAVPAEMIDTLERERVTNAFLVPAMLQFMCDVPGAAERDYSSLRAISYGASPITTEVLKRSLTTFGVPLAQVYGLTETTGSITQLRPEDHDPGGPREYLLRSAGKPFPWVELKIVDAATGEVLPAGEVGEVWARTPQNTPGYYNRPTETERLLAGDGWVRSGDAGYLDDDGYLFITDRIKDMIVSGAENVYPIEVENVLAEHPGVADVAVIGVPDEKWGETVKAVVVRAEGDTTTEEELIAWSRPRLAGFKRPRSVDFVPELPRNPSGKILKKELRRPYWEGRSRNVG
ncbi:MAG: long-chain-fatty-acid--CoA ligase [Streptosporangiales bacterium]|nr:long-chain-fatty-acid--CoA ligase [Streptosporangiales bacterium]